MRAPQQDEKREQRIAMEIVVDCYHESEAWSGWWCYLDGKLGCPFVAECIRARRTSPLKVGERVTVTAMLDDEEASDSLGEMQVKIAWQGRTLGVPLAQLRGIGGDEETAEAISGLALLGGAGTAVLIRPSQS